MYIHNLMGMENKRTNLDCTGLGYSCIRKNCVLQYLFRENDDVKPSEMPLQTYWRYRLLMHCVYRSSGSAVTGHHIAHLSDRLSCSPTQESGETNQPSLLRSSGKCLMAKFTNHSHFDME